MMFRRALVLIVLAALGLVASAATASAHPLGNFTTNQLVKVSIGEREVAVGVVLDLAEIPSYQLVQRYDRDGDGQIAGAELGPARAELEREIESGLVVSADGRRLRLQGGTGARLTFPPGQAGLSLTRLEAAYRAPLPAGAARVEVRNDAFADRRGWRAIQVLPGEGTDVTSDVPATDPTDGLRVYPQDVLASPSDVSEASFAVEAGDGGVSAPDGIDGAGFTADRASDGFAGLLTADSHGALLLLLLAAAFGWGALHALSPGHGKAMVAGYLAGSRGTPRHAVALGATVTATHTAAVFALGLITLAASQYVLPEDLYPWLGLASGLTVVGIGLTVMRSRYRRWRLARSSAATAHAHHPHQHHHDHGAPVRMRELVGLGVSGGLVPCPSALVVLVAAISQHRVGFGMVLIVAFSLGLAATVTGVGLATIWGRRVVARLRPEQRLFGGRLSGALPAISASAIVLVGVLITYRAVPALG